MTGTADDVLGMIDSTLMDYEHPEGMRWSPEPSAQYPHILLLDGETLVTSWCDTRELLRQIGMMNVLATSGGRVEHRDTGVTLRCGSGYSVTVDLSPDDTYTVRRIFTRARRTWVKGERAGVHCGQLGETVYRAGCFRDMWT